MARRPTTWAVLAALFAVGNAAGAVFAMAAGEMVHAGIHVALVFPGAYLSWRLSPWRSGRGAAERAAQLGAFADHLTHIEQSVDAVAIEVERIGEGQRFVTKLFADNAAARARETAADPAEIKARRADPS